MKKTIFLVAAVAASGCAYHPASEQQAVTPSACIGTSDLPESRKDKFTPAVDKTLLDKALGEPDKGGLCQGRVYKSKENAEIKIYRAWNSTNPNSRLGNWWAFEIPAGKVATYRSDYEICYQWSPLDKLETCTLKAGTKVVVGTGQSAQCSQYLNYPVSEAQQIYIDDAQQALSDCASLDGEFSWE